MSCMDLSDCASMKCSKVGSQMICINGGCACTLPKILKFVSKSFFLIFLIVLVVLLTLITRFSSAKPDYIPSSRFTGARHGYVFKRTDGQLGYFKDFGMKKK